MVTPIHTTSTAHQPNLHTPSCLSQTLSLALRIIHGIALAIITPVVIFCAYKWLAHEWRQVIQGTSPSVGSTRTPPPSIPLSDRSLEQVENVLYIRKDIIKNYPEVVLEKVITGKPIHISYLPDNLQRDDLVRAHYVDWGGPSRTFITELAQSLLSEREGRALRTQDGILSLENTDHRSTYVHLGAFFSYIHARNLDPHLGGANTGSFSGSLCANFGRLLPDTFFTLLKLIHCKPHASDVEIAKLLFTSQEHLSILAYIEGDISKKDEAEENLQTLGYTSKEEYLEELPQEIAARVNAAKAVLEGLSYALKTKLTTLSAQEFSSLIQGNPLNANEIIARISCYIYANQVIQQKYNFLKEIIREKLDNGDTKWVERLLIAVTGSPALTASTHISFTSNYERFCHAMTCTKTLDVPNTHETYPFDEPDLKKRFLANLEILMDDSISTVRSSGNTNY